jgi:DNA-binding MarR family transcriptional regulator
MGKNSGKDHGKDPEVDFIQSIGLLVRRVRAAAGSHDFPLTETAVVKRLAAEGPATTAELARAEGMKPQSMGAAVASLERKGIVQRKPHPSDGRQQNIELTKKGAAMRERERAAKRTWLAEAIAQLDKRDQKTLFTAGKIIERLAKL